MLEDIRPTVSIGVAEGGHLLALEYLVDHHSLISCFEAHPLEEVGDMHPLDMPDGLLRRRTDEDQRDAALLKEAEQFLRPVGKLHIPTERFVAVAPESIHHIGSHCSWHAALVAA